MKQASAGRSAIFRSQWRVLAVTSVAVALLVPVAIAWACNPQARVAVDKPTYFPGDTMGVTGSYFQGDRTLTLSVEPGGASVTVRTSSNGFFATQIPAPTSAGSYTLSAIGFEADGTVTNGLPARVSFSVAQRSTAPQPNTTAPGAQRSPATSPGTSQPSAGSFAEPTVPNAGRISPRARSRARAQGDARTGARADRTAAVNTGAGVIAASGDTVFAGSVARADRVAGSPAARPAARKARSGAQRAVPSERSAASDVWSGLSSSNAPALLPSASDGAPSGGGAGSGLALGLGLIGFALLALAGAVAVDRRRRRASAR